MTLTYGIASNCRLPLDAKYASTSNSTLELTYSQLKVLEYIKNVYYLTSYTLTFFLSLPKRSNFTFPVINANKVWSFPIPTFTPG